MDTIPQVTVATNKQTNANIQQIDAQDNQKPRLTASDWFRGMQFNPAVNKATVGVQTDRVTPQLLLSTTKSLLRVSRGQQQPSSKDSLAFQRFYGPAQYFAEHVQRDGGRVARNLLWKATNKGNLDFMAPKSLQPHISSVFYDSNLAQYLDGSTPFQAIDLTFKTTRVGQGGIASTDSAPDEMRVVQPSYFGYVDPIRSPERGGVGLSGYLTKNVMKGTDGKLYQKFINAHTGKQQYVDSVTAANSVVATNDAYNEGTKSIFALGGKTGVRIVDRDKVDYILPRPDQAYSTGSNMVTMFDAIKQMRLLMGCVHPQTPVIFVDGCNNVHIETANRVSAHSGIKMVSSDKYGRSVLRSLSKVATLLATGKKSFYKVILSSGRTLITSPDHNWSVIQDGKLVKVKATKLTTGMQVARSVFTDVPYSRTYIFDVPVDQQIAVLLGRIQRSIQYTKTNPRFCITVQQKDIIKSALAKLGIHNVHVNKRANGLYINIADRRFVDWIEQNIGMQKQKRHVPSCILSAGIRLVAAFLDSFSKQVDNVGMDGNGDVWLLNLDNEIVRTSMAFLLSRIYTDTLFRDLTVNGQLMLALKLIPRTTSFGNCAIDTVKTILKIKSPGYMIDFDVDDNVYAVASGIITHNSKYATQAVPLVQREVPLVQSLDRASGKAMQQLIGKKLGTKWADQDGVVTAVRNDKINVAYADGTKATIDLYKDFPANIKGFMQNRSLVKAGDKFKKGQLLAASNFTDDNGVAAMGRNMRVGYISYRGGTYEDACVLSQSAAKKFTSDVMYKTAVDLDKTIRTGKRLYTSWKPNQYTDKQLQPLDDSGIVKPGSIVNRGDPLFLAVQTTQPSPGTLGKRVLTDKSQIWQHDHPGTITDVVRTKNGIKVYARVQAPVQVGDKVSARYGNKGTVTQIIPDDQMPKDSQGRPLQMLMSPLGIVSRTNPAQLYQTQLGKIAQKTGHPILVPQFTDGQDRIQWVKAMSRKYGVPLTQDVYDPSSNRTLKGILTGQQYVYKLKHMAQSKMSARGTAQYNAQGTPASGGQQGSKRFGGLQSIAMIGHGAFNTLVTDAKLIRGQQNAQFWRQIRTGQVPTVPGQPLVHKKFFAHLQGSGVHVRKTNKGISVFALTNKDVDQLTGPRQVRSRDTYQTKNYRPMNGGLFGTDVFGMNGDKWGYIKLDQPILNPVMQQPIAKLLRLPDKKLTAILQGQQQLNGKTGSPAIYQALKDIDIHKQRINALNQLKSASKSNKDAAVKRYVAIARMDNAGVQPAQFMLNKIPVVPPQFRPITSHNGLTMVADANYLYAQLIDARDDMRQAKNLPQQYMAQARKNLYKKYKQLTGLYDPQDVKLQSKSVKGLLKWAFGDSPKCHDDQTDILTQNGWMPFKDYNDKSLRIATVDPVTDQFQWQYPQDIIHQRIDGQMIQLKTRVIDALVTSQHDMYVSKRCRQGGKNIFIPYTKLSAQYMYQHSDRYKVKTAATAYNGTQPSPPISVQKYAFANFVGWFIAQGWLHPDMCTAYISVKADGRDDRKLNQMFSRLGCAYYRRVYVTKSHCVSYPDKSTIPLITPAGYRSVYYSINSKQLCQWLAENIGKGAKTKKLSTQIKSWSTPYLKQLVDGWFWGDGSKNYLPKKLSNRKTWQNRSTVSDNGTDITTSSLYLVDDLQQIGAKIGVQMALIRKPDNRENRNTCYRVSIHGFDYSMIQGKKQIKKCRYVGGVHCATVPNGLLVTRRHGRVLVSGNSGGFQRKVFGSTVDTVGRGVVVPNSRLKLNQIGMPQPMAWGVFSPFISRALVRAGYSPVQALRQVKQKTPLAKQYLLKAMQQRPVLMNRAPSLHKLSIMGFHPVLVTGHAIHVNPSIVGPFGMDFDGDSICGSVGIWVKLDEIEKNIEKSSETHLTTAFQAVQQSIDTNKLTNKETGEMLSKEAKADFVSSVATLAELPVVEGSEVKKSDTVTEWDVKQGYYTSTVDPATGELQMCRITKVSKHSNLKMFDVTMSASGAYKTVVTASEDHSLITLNPETLVLEKTRPEDAAGRCVPQTRSCVMNNWDTCVKTMDIAGQRPMTYELGMFIGIMLGDGWVDTWGSVRIACCNESLQKYISELCTVENAPVPMRKDASLKTYPADPQRFSQKDKQVFYMYLNQPVSSALHKLIGDGAYNKHIPAACFLGSRAHMIGVLMGLLATDGSVTYSTGGKKVTKSILLHTISPELRDGVQHLCRRLGIRSSATPYMGANSKSTCYAVAFSLEDIAREAKAHPAYYKIPMQEKQEAFEKIVEDSLEMKKGGVSYTRVPFPRGLFCEFSWANVKDVAKDIVIRARATGNIARSVALKIAEHLENVDWTNYSTPSYIKKEERTNRSPEEAKALVDKWIAIVRDENIGWSVVESVTPSSCTEGWDCTVPGPYTFSLADGTVVQDTVNIHVPVSKASVDQINSKMLPQRNLIALSDNKILYAPQKQYIQGLYIATRMQQGKKPKTFRSIQQAKQAYRNGTIDIDDPIQIK